MGTDFVGDGAKPGEIDNPRIGAAASDNKFWPVLPCELFDIVEIDAAIIRADAVGGRIEPFSRQIWPRSVREMATRGERHSENGVARLEERDKHRLISLRPGMRLHVGEAAAEESLGALDRERLGDIDEFAPAIVPAAGIAFGVFVRQNRALGLQYRPGDDVLAGNQFDLELLAFSFSADRRGNLRISL